MIAMRDDGWLRYIIKKSKIIIQNVFVCMYIFYVIIFICQLWINLNILLYFKREMIIDLSNKEWNIQKILMIQEHFKKYLN